MLKCLCSCVGFLCGVCPNGTTVDLTLSLCLTCHWWDMLVQVVFSKLFEEILIGLNKMISIWHE